MLIIIYSFLFVPEFLISPGSPLDLYSVCHREKIVFLKKHKKRRGEKYVRRRSRSHWNDWKAFTGHNFFWYYFSFLFRDIISDRSKLHHDWSFFVRDLQTRIKTVWCVRCIKSRLVWRFTMQQCESLTAEQQVRRGRWN